MGEEVDDGEEWVRRARQDPTLVAMALLALGDRMWDPEAGPERSPSPAGSPSAAPCGLEPLDSAPYRPAAAGEVATAVAATVEVAAALPKLGPSAKRKRSRKITMAGMLAARRYEEAAAAAAAKADVKKNPATPPSPLDYNAGSDGPSTSGRSGGEEGSSSPAENAAKKPKTAEPDAVIPVSAAAGGGGRLPMKVQAREEQAPLVFRLPPQPKAIRRPGKKKTIPELQAWERELLAERTALEKVVEARRRAHEALMVENRKLKSALKLHRTSCAAVPLVSEEKQQSEAPNSVALSSPVQSRKDSLLLPDLNEPFPEHFD